MRPHISILHYSAPPVIGGVEKVIADHTRLLLRAGYSLTILTGRGGDALAQSGARVVVIPEIDSEYPQNVEISRALAEQRVVPEFGELQAEIEGLLKPHLDGAGVLIVHNVLTTHYNLPLASALFRQLDSGSLPPTIAWVHDISRHVNPRSGFPQHHGFPWDLLRTFRPNLHYVAVSSRRRQALADTLRCPPTRIRVIPNGVAPELLLSLSQFGRGLVKEFRLFDADLILLMPVRVTRAKNIEYAISLVNLIKQAGWQPRLVITGPPDPHSHDSRAYFQRLITQSHDLGLDREVIFVYKWVTQGRQPMVVDSTNIAELYRIADVVLMPSHREGFGLPVLEAGLAGRAVFAADIPAVDEVGVDRVYGIGKNELPEQLARRMLDWAEHDVEHRLRRRVRRGFTWQAIFERDIEPLLLECSHGVKEQV